MDQAKPTSDAKEMIISIQTGSIARYKIGEQLARLPTPITAVGETTGITGKVFLDSLGNISDSDISTINVNVESLRSDKNKRDNWVQRNGGIGPEITIQLTKVTGHPWPLPESGKLDVVIDGNMTISGITNPTEWNGILTIEESSLTGLISTEITWDQFSLSKPKLPFIISVDDEIVLELDVLADIQK
jgi:polyisoprenoid-binding protein YceI